MRKAIEYRPRSCADTIPPSSRRSPFIAKKPSVEDTSIHLPNASSSWNAAGSQCKRLAGPDSMVCVSTVRSAAPMIQPPTSARIDGSIHAHDTTATTDTTLQTISSWLRRASESSRRASATLVDSMPLSTAVKPTAAMT